VTGARRPLPRLVGWVAQRAHPFPLTPGAVLPELSPPVSAAAVVGLAAAVRTARELVLATHALLRTLVHRAGFRAVSIEGTDLTGAAIDRYVTTGAGDPTVLLRASPRFLRTREALDVLR
jgi:erythromycin esterase